MGVREMNSKTNRKLRLHTDVIPKCNSHFFFSVKLHFLYQTGSSAKMWTHQSNFLLRDAVRPVTVQCTGYNTAKTCTILKLC